MVGSFSPLTAAVSRAGGLGSLACASLTPGQVFEQVRLIRMETASAFNLNFFCHAHPKQDPIKDIQWRSLLLEYYAEQGVALPSVASAGRMPFDEVMCEVIEEIKPAVVSFHFGLPAQELMQRVRNTGAVILSSATTVQEALWLEDRGVDAVIAQGREAGGHRGMFQSDDIEAQPGLFALLPQVVDAVQVPVIAAGAIADGRGIAAAFALGASAVQLGTAYLRTPQAGRSEAHLRAIAEAREDSTRLTNLFTGRPARGQLNRFMREKGPMNASAPAFPLAAQLVNPLSASSERQGSNEFSMLWSGEAAAMAKAADAEELTRELWEEGMRISKSIGSI